MRIALAIGTEEHLQRALQLHDWRIAAPGDPRELAHDGERPLLDFGGGGRGGRGAARRQRGAEVDGAGEPGQSGNACSRAGASHRPGQGLCPAIWYASTVTRKRFSRPPDGIRHSKGAVPRPGTTPLT